MKKRELLAAYATKYQGNWMQINRAVLKEETEDLPSVNEPYITILDPEYPQQLKKLERPPWVLFYRGNISLLRRQMITIVGSREMTEYGKCVTGLITDYLKNDFVIVSGLAKGVDGESHHHAIINGKTIGVVGHGLDTEYPACNHDLYQIMKQRHLILSEFPVGTPIRKYHFPYRNRILAALSCFVIVTQAVRKSGTFHTVNEALNIGIEVYCIPYPFMEMNGEGCNSLIQEGANILFELEQLDELIEMYSVEK